MSYFFFIFYFFIIIYIRFCNWLNLSSLQYKKILLFITIKSFRKISCCVYTLRGKCILTKYCSSIPFLPVTTNIVEIIYYIKKYSQCNSDIDQIQGFHWMYFLRRRRRCTNIGITSEIFPVKQKYDTKIGFASGVYFKRNNYIARIFAKIGCISNYITV